jgi:hypothetical protein
MKHIVYKYGSEHSDEMAFDAHGSMILEKGNIVSRHGISWRIESVELEPSMEKLLRIPTYWVYLARVVVN